LPQLVLAILEIYFIYTHVLGKPPAWVAALLEKNTETPAIKKACRRFAEQGMADLASIKLAWRLFCGQGP